MTSTDYYLHYNYEMQNLTMMMTRRNNSARRLQIVIYTQTMRFNLLTFSPQLYVHSSHSHIQSVRTSQLKIYVQ